jgi:tRNA pseudouridine38-40 synthase
VFVQKIKLTIAYDGTDFHGFQAQTRRDATIRTVQSVLEESLERVTGHPVPVTGAGRTDAGVHAKAQVVTFESAGAVPVERWPRVLNHRLPRDVVVISARSVPPSFHPRYDAVAKVYRYTIDTAPVPDIFTRRFCTHFTEALDVERMQQAARYLIGKHDFTSFSAARAQVSNRIRTLRKVDVWTDGTYVHFLYEGNGFLQHMVRILTGTLVEVGITERQPDDIPHILKAKDRREAGRTMPPEGLTLWKVKYS